ncbi:MAG: hypothetical protein M3T96_01610 [Acidobacteriota bacterium]|nr:hypothetical protein [Acidobacteriota bacterium]
MTKYLLLLSFSLIFSFGFGSSQSARQNFVVNPAVTPTPVVQNDFEEIILDKDSVCNPCQPGYRPNEGSECDINMVIKVSAGETENDNFSYKYAVSGGRIIGEGANVDWDMTATPPGSYRIDIDVQNKLNGLHRKETKTITVGEQTCGGVCDCPTLLVDASKASVKAGETMTFTANVSGGGSETVTYDWTVSEGVIIKGQGTPVIAVATNAKMAGKTVKATIDIGGVCEECIKTAEAVGTVAATKRRRKHSE